MNRKSILQTLFIVLGFFCLTGNAVLAQVIAQTTVFTYQGKLTDNGASPQIVYEMEFRLYGSAGGAEQIGGTITNPNVFVNQGAFTVNLDFGALVFDGSDRYLEIAVRRNANESFITLNPRQQIASSPYSIRTLSAEKADVAIDANNLGGIPASDYVTTSSVGNSFIKNATTQQTANFNVSGNGIVGGTLGVGGTAQAGQTFDVTGNSIFRTANGNVNFGSPNGEIGLSITGTNRADFRFNNSTLKIVAGSGVLPPSDTNGIVINTSGNVGIGTTAPTSKLDIVAQDGLRITGFQPFMTFRDTNNSNLRSILQSVDGGFLFYPNNFIGGNPLMAIKNSGNVGIGSTGPPTRLQIVGGPAWTSAGWSGSLSMGNAGAIGWEANASGQRFGIGQSTGGLYFFRTNSAFGSIASPANYDMQITDTGRVQMKVLQITGGSDLAENFEVGGDVKPGMVVAIDPNNAGKLILASGAYNRQVVGVISGANNLAAGMLLPDLNGSENSSPVALSGRVWVYVDATKNPIKPGDLLTTSDTPGYAMKVKKHKKANGAIIGKAMTKLTDGKGLVLMLISLQ